MIPEELLHFIWQFRLYQGVNLRCTNGEELQVLQVGQANSNAGPDFLYSKLLLDGREWSGHVELHVQGGDWIKHRHQEDAAYNAVILHVVWADPRICFRADGTSIPTLLLAESVNVNLLDNYANLMHNLNWIPCAPTLHSVPQSTIQPWLTRMSIARLEDKYEVILLRVKQTKQDWERVLFELLCRAFGMKVNAEAFSQLAKIMDIKLIRKSLNDQQRVEALFLGQSGLLNKKIPSDEYLDSLRTEYAYLQKIHHLTEMKPEQWKFLRMRPYNFPSYRLAQLSALYARKVSLFDSCLSISSLADLHELLDQASVSPFWHTHFSLQTSTKWHPTNWSNTFVAHLSINAFLPLLFAYGKFMDLPIYSEKALLLMESLPPEKNRLVQRFRQLGITITSAADSQALLHMKDNLCDSKKCLHCQIGYSLLKLK